MNSKQQGNWEILAMEVWDKDFIDMVETGHVSISHDGTGSIVFGALNGQLDGVYDSDTARFEFSWIGSDDGDPVNGRGWVKCQSNREAVGHIYIHMGEDSSMTLAKQL